MAGSASTTAAGASVRHLRDLFGVGSAAVGLDDGQLLARYSASGDASAFEALVARHGPMVLATARSVLRREQDVEDAFQATFLVLARKAGSVRAGDALGGWLHRVARRSAVQASVEARRRNDREGGPAGAIRAIPAPGAQGPDPDLRAILHEEVDRLPEGRRLPVVLCDLEGLTYEEAARRLRWTVPTLRNRLARARRELKGRLTRRGVTGAGLLLPRLPLPAVPGATARAAVSGPASTGPVTLANLVLKGMLMARIKLAATAALAALTLASAGLVALARMPGDAPSAPVAAPAPAGQPEPAGRPPEGEIRGVVLGPDGRPVAGATVGATWFDEEDGRGPRASTGPDGRFALRGVRKGPEAVPLDGGDESPWVVASAAGFGPGWASAGSKGDPPADVTIRLVEPGRPIEGRVLDLEGRPVGGARVRVERLHYVHQGQAPYSETGDLGPYLAGVRAGRNRGALDLVPTPRPIETTAGADGRFRLADLGRERIVALLVSHPSIATTEAYAMTRDGAEVRTPPGKGGMMIGDATVYHAPRFDLAVAPARVVRGVARDKDSGRPIAGLKIEAAVFDERNMIPAPGVEATTDAEGRYAVLGLPPAPSYRVFVTPGAGLPYTNATFEAPAGPDRVGPTAFDFVLKRGVMVRGRVTDRATGRPVSGYVEAFTLDDNPHVAGFPGYIESNERSAPLDADGRFAIATPPGRGILACRADDPRYRAGVGAGSIPGYDPKADLGLSTFPSGIYAPSFHVLKAIDLDPKAEEATHDLQVEPGGSVEVTVLDPDGRPTGGYRVAEANRFLIGQAAERPGPTFPVLGLEPGQARRLTVVHAGRKLAGSAFLKGDEAGPMTIRLQPWGVVVGRLVDDEGRPLKGVDLISSGVTRSGGLPEGSGFLPDVRDGEDPPGEDGRFRVEGLVPGLKYAASALENRTVLIGEVFRDVVVAPGEVKDLGDLKVTPLKGAQ